MLKIEQLDVKERSGRYLLKDISMEIPAGHVIGLTGKSGSGRTTLLRSILGMLHTSCHIDAGKILLDDIDLSHLSRKSHRELCGKKLGFIPQNPMTAFDSRLKIGYQMQETFVNRLHLNTSEATDLAKEKLFSVNLKDTDRILDAYPSELSGGMLQRVATAILLGMSPDYVLADEPTAALDEENRDLLLLIMREQMKDKGILALGKTHGKFVAHLVSFLCSDFPRTKGLPYLISDHIAFLPASVYEIILPLGKHKFFIDCQRTTLVATHQFTLLGLIGVLHIVCAAFQTGRNGLSLILVQCDQSCRSHHESPP